MSQIEGGEARKAVGTGMRIAFGVGALAENLVLYSVATFAMLFYNQVLGLPAYQAGLIVSFSLLVDALIDPVIGAWSDRTRSRLGRRHPFMFAAALPLSLAFAAVFNPPAGLSHGGLLAWLFASIIALRVALALYMIPHTALGAELSSDYFERTSLMSYAGFFYWVGSSFTWWSAYALFFPTTPDYPTGLLNPAGWPTYGATMALIVLTATLCCAWFTRSRIPLLPQPLAQARFSLTTFWRDLLAAFGNRNLLVILSGFLIYWIMNGIRDGLWLYTANYYWRLSSEELSWWVVGSALGYGFGFVAARRIHKIADKKRTLLWATIIFVFGPPLGNLLAFAGIIGPETPHVNAVLIALSIFEHAPQAMITITILSMLADIADENQLRVGVRQEGVLYSNRLLAYKIGQAIGTAIAGALVTLVALPASAKPGTVDARILHDLNVAYTLGSLPGFVAALIFARYAITRSRWLEIREALGARSG